MLTQEEYIDKLKKKVSELMYQNPDMFPIVNHIFFGAEFYHIPQKDLEFYVRYNIETRIGLGHIIRNFCNNADMFRWSMTPEFNKELERTIIKSVIIIYFTSDWDGEKLDKFNKLI